jgi:translation initiation factor IF-3
VPEVRVIGDDSAQLGVMPTHEAMRMAEEKGLDLVEVSPKAVPPVCRIMDYGKFKYEQSKKTNQAKKHASVIEIKEIKFRPKTDVHDYEFKVGHIRRFLEEGNKVRLVIAFRGREIVHPETGAMLEKVIKKCSDVAHVEQIPMMDGRRMVMVVSPRPGRPGAPITPTTTTSAPTAVPGAMIGRPSTAPAPSGPSTPVAPAAASPAPAAGAPATAPAAAGSAPRPNQPPVASSARPVGNRPNPPVRSGS